MRKAILAVLLTFGVLILEVVGEATFGSKNKSWSAIEKIINFPGYLALYAMGPGHGFSQLVFPILFVFLSYLLLFWLIILLFERSLKRFKS